MSYPLKQGLKRVRKMLSNFQKAIVKVSYPLKQGKKTTTFLHGCFFCYKKNRGLKKK